MFLGNLNINYIILNNPKIFDLFFKKYFLQIKLNNIFKCNEIFKFNLLFGRHVLKLPPYYNISSKRFPKLRWRYWCSWWFTLTQMRLMFKSSRKHMQEKRNKGWGLNNEFSLRNSQFTHNFLGKYFPVLIYALGELTVKTYK
jgi:hypothetical protein